MRRIELLAPARDAATAREAVLHGADAVYLGGPAFGARQAAANSIGDIRETVEFAHKYRAKVYVTLNTVILDRELKEAEQIIRSCYEAGVDALIVQDLGLLRLDLPPIALHASTQCDTRTPEKARFLQDVGFSQIVLARELGIGEIREICKSVKVPVEVFVHGALCVSYSGRCHVGQVWKGRSANRGECPQVCRLPFTLRDASGRVLTKDKHLLSLRDFNATGRLEELLDAGVSSFKIEGRLKDAAYVKNITAWYRQRLDEIFSRRPEEFCRSSFGESEVTFEPNPEKSFNRGFTEFFLTQRRPPRIASLLTPKSLGEKIEDPSKLNNGDGVSFFTPDGYQGARINRVEGRRIIPAPGSRIPEGVELRRTYDRVWEAMLERPTASRKIDVDVDLDPTGATATDERGMRVRVPLGIAPEKALKPMDFSSHFAKLGATVYRLRSFKADAMEGLFLPASVLSAVRRDLCAALDLANTATYPFDSRRLEESGSRIPVETADYRENVANREARKFYSDHGASEMPAALESGGESKKGDVVMTCRHCVLRELGRCLKENGPLPQPLRLESEGLRLALRFDCKRCEMQVLQD